MRHTFTVYERLKREQHIDTLFRSGKAFSVFPVRVIYSFVPRAEGELSPVRVGFSVPKKRFKSSVKRHRVRRLLAESWRLHKHGLYPLIPPPIQLHVFLIFTDGTIPEYEPVLRAVVKGIEKLTTLAASFSGSQPEGNQDQNSQN